MDDMNRIEWDEFFMWTARLISMRSVCLHYKVGVIFTKGNKIVSGGYNGPPKGEVHCAKVGCAREDRSGNKLPAGSGLCRGAHAEVNAVYNSASMGGVSLKDTVVFCTYSPCYSCAKHLVNLGIKEFVYELDYDNNEEATRVAELFMRQGIGRRKFVPPDDVLKEIMNRYLGNYSTDEIMAILGRPELELGIKT
ncbi:MAG: deaminase [Patescibacteria group bacterium]